MNEEITKNDPNYVVPVDHNSLNPLNSEIVKSELVRHHHLKPITPLDEAVKGDNITELAKSIRREMHSTGMSKFQFQNFVINSEHTPWRRVRQIILELEARYQSYEEAQWRERKMKCELDIELEDAENAKSPARKKMHLENAERIKWKIQELHEKGYEQSVYEIKTLEAMLAEYNKRYDILALVKNADIEEEHYWTERLAFQAATDIATVGKIQLGNLQSLKQLPEQQYKQTLKAIARNTQQINEETKALSHITQNYGALSFELRDQMEPELRRVSDISKQIRTVDGLDSSLISDAEQTK